MKVVLLFSWVSPVVAKRLIRDLVLRLELLTNSCEYLVLAVSNRLDLLVFFIK